MWILNPYHKESNIVRMDTLQIVKDPNFFIQCEFFPNRPVICPNKRGKHSKFGHLDVLKLHFMLDIEIKVSIRPNPLTVGRTLKEVCFSPDSKNWRIQIF